MYLYIYNLVNAYWLIHQGMLNMACCVVVRELVSVLKPSDRSAMSDRKTLSPPVPMSYLCGLALRIWTSFKERRFRWWTCGTLQWCSQDSLWHTGWWKAWAWKAQDDMETADREGLQRVEAQPSTLMIDIPGDLVWDLPCMQQASYLEGGPLVWMLPLYLHVNQKSDYDMMIWIWLVYILCKYMLCNWGPHGRLAIVC